jgi:hypothetical protein
MVDERLFTILCAWNLGGYDTSAGDSGRMHPVREEVRQYLQELDPSLVRMVELKVGARSHTSPLGAIFMHVPYAFSLSPPPEFEELRPVKYIAPGFNAVMRRLYTEGDLDQLWKRYENDYREVLKGYESLLPEAIEESNEYLRVEEAPLSRPLVIVPTFMLERGSGLNCPTEDSIYLILGPTQRPGSSIIQHEYLHQVVGPMLDRHADLLSDSEALFEWVASEDAIFGDYGSWRRVVEESLLRAMPQRFPSHRDWEEVEEYIQKNEEIGLLLTRYFYEALEDYEAQDEMSFEEFLPTLLEGIDVEREQEEWQELEGE